MGNRWIMGLLGLVAALTLGAHNQAEAQDLGGARTHDGFYFQALGGIGYASTSGNDVDQSISGLELDVSLMLGGSPMPGLAIGGGLFLDYLPSPGAELGGVEQTGISSHYLVGIGLFGDFYPDPKDGLHFQAFGGWGGAETAFDGNVGGSDPTGLMLSIGGGYDVWVGDESSAGGLLRFVYAPLSINDSGFTSISIAALANFTYN